ncbi:MAG: hypothetical protein ACRDND_34705 [Streptosporangiaceae bacterium]
MLGTERVRLADLAALLRDLAPEWGPYRTLTGIQLREQLDDAGVRVTNTNNVLRLDPADLRQVLAGRQGEADGDELGGHHQSHAPPGGPARRPP